MISAWLPVLGCVALLILLAALPAGHAPRTSPAKIALLYGIRPLWGETDASVRERSAAASRGSSGEQQAHFVWWARAARRIGAEITHRLR
jgi:hypothetical protein